MKKRLTDDRAPVRWLRIPIDAETEARLHNLSDECHADPCSVAASLLHDVLADDEQAEYPAATAVGSASIN